MNPPLYRETFDNGPGGWYGMIDNFQGVKPLPVQNGIISSYAPWWIDYNHAPPGAGYLHLLMGLYTRGPLTEAMREYAGRNHFIEQQFPTNFTNLTMSLRLRGELELRGAQMLLLIQGHHDGVTSGWLLTGQPIPVTPHWSEPSIHLTPDPVQWTPLGSRAGRQDYYQPGRLATTLADVNVNLYLVLTPLNVVPMGPLAGDPHTLRAGRDYRVWTSKLPDGYIQVDTITMNFDLIPSSNPPTRNTPQSA